MKIPLIKRFVMKSEVQRDVFPCQPAISNLCTCAPPRHSVNGTADPGGRTSLCISQKAGLTAEAALILPFFLMILLAFFSFFSNYACRAELKTRACAEAKKTGTALGGIGKEILPEIIIFKTKSLDQLWINPFVSEKRLTERAVCRAWIGFTELEIKETYVYITPDGNVYHLYGDCTHLDLSVRSAAFSSVAFLKNEYGETYRPCELCGKESKALVYITSDGNRYHSKRSCSGLKRTVRQIPISEVGSRSCCLRCMSKGE